MAKRKHRQHVCHVWEVVVRDGRLWLVFAGNSGQAVGIVASQIFGLETREFYSQQSPRVRVFADDEIIACRIGGSVVERHARQWAHRRPHGLFADVVGQYST